MNELDHWRNIALASAKANAYCDILLAQKEKELQDLKTQLESVLKELEELKK